MFDIVLQGQVYPYTQDVVNEYRKQEWVDTIYVSTWEGQPSVEHATCIYNKDVPNPGVGNRNRQIKSSRKGLDLVTSEYVIKGRTDQIMLDLPLMKAFHDKYTTGQIFVCGLYKAFPFHPRDHFFMGPTEKVQDLFNIPYDPYSGEADYSKILRAEAWIGSYYYSRYSTAAAEMLMQPLKYLVDGAPCIEQALALDFSMRDSLFKVFPRINFAWPKHGLSSYHYHIGEQFTEYWHEGDW